MKLDSCSSCFSYLLEIHHRWKHLDPQTFDVGRLTSSFAYREWIGWTAHAFPHYILVLPWHCNFLLIESWQPFAYQHILCMPLFMRVWVCQSLERSAGLMSQGSQDRKGWVGKNIWVLSTCVYARVCVKFLWDCGDVMNVEKDWQKYGTLVADLHFEGIQSSFLEMFGLIVHYCI